MKDGWYKVEMEIKYDSPSGYIKIWENGVIKGSYTGSTDCSATGSSSCVYKPNNPAIRTDVYVDYSLARIVLANNQNYSQATIIEPQIPSVWNTTSITATVNLGKFSDGQMAYLFVFDSNGERNTNGFPLTVGNTTTLVPPKNLRITTQP
jgi:hypothetical protein